MKHTELTLKQLGIFVDVQNIYYTTKETFSRNFDYNAFWKEATKDYSVHCAFAYAIARGNEKQKQFQNVLRGIGFEVRLKPFIQRLDGSAKGDWDVGITIDVMENAPNLDKVILLSGDGDFTILMNKIKDKHKVNVEVYGVRALTASSLIVSADNYREIDQTLLI